MDSAWWQIIVGLLALGSIVQAVVLVGVLREVGGILLRLSPSRAGEIDGGPDRGSTVRLPNRELTRPSIAVFISPNCGPCEGLFPGLPAFRRDYAELDLILIPAFLGDQAADDGVAQFPVTIRALLSPALSELYEEWSVPGTPFAVAIDDHQRVLETGVTNHLEHLEAMAESLLRREAPAVLPEPTLHPPVASNNTHAS